MKTNAFAVFIGLAAFAISAPALAQNDDDYIHCLLSDGTHDTVYFSGVFLGDYSHKERYEVAFSRYVHAEYPDVIGTGSCFFEDNPSAARSEQDGMKASKRRVYDNIISTGWTY